MFQNWKKLTFEKKENMWEKSRSMLPSQPRSACSRNRCCLYSPSSNISVFIQGKHLSCKGFKNRNGKWFRAELEKKQNVTTSSFPWWFISRRKILENSRYQGSEASLSYILLRLGGFATCTIVSSDHILSQIPVERSHISCDFRGRGRNKVGQMGTECSKSQHFRIF